MAFFRTLGGALGVSALGVVLAHRVTDLMVRGLVAIGIDPSAHGLRRGDPGPVRRSRRTCGSSSSSRSATPIADLFLVAAPVALVSLIAVLFLKEVPLGTRSGIEQLLEQEGEALAPATAARAVDPTDAELDAPDAEQSGSPRATDLTARATRAAPGPSRPGAALSCRRTACSVRAGGPPRGPR